MLNKIMLIGNLGKDPEFSVTSGGTAVAKFSLAVNRNSKDRVTGERKTETEWFNIVVWNQLAEVCEKYLHKGSKVYIEGRLTQRKWTDNQGVQRISVEVITNDMEMLDTKAASGGSGNFDTGSSSSYGSGRPAPAPAPSDDYDPFLDTDDLP